MATAAIRKQGDDVEILWHTYIMGNVAMSKDTKEGQRWLDDGFVPDEISAMMQPFQGRTGKVPKVGQRVELKAHGRLGAGCRLSGEVIQVLSPPQGLYPQQFW